MITKLKGNRDRVEVFIGWFLLVIIILLWVLLGFHIRSVNPSYTSSYEVQLPGGLGFRLTSATLDPEAIDNPGVFDLSGSNIFTTPKSFQVDGEFYTGTVTNIDEACYVLSLLLDRLGLDGDGYSYGVTLYYESYVFDRYYNNVLVADTSYLLYLDADTKKVLGASGMYYPGEITTSLESSFKYMDLKYDKKFEIHLSRLVVYKNKLYRRYWGFKDYRLHIIDVDVTTGEIKEFAL
jgi:hypothetical protein